MAAAVIEAERQAALQCLGQLERLRIMAAAVSPALEALVAAAIPATGCNRAQALRRGRVVDAPAPDHQLEISRAGSC